MMNLRNVESYLRYRSVVRNPWQAARARRGVAAGTLVGLRLRRGGTVHVRAGTSDMRVFKDVFVKDAYRLVPFEAGALDTVLDVGGHIGLFSIRVAPLARRVISCEPVPSNAELFRRNVTDTGCDNITLEPTAVTSMGGTAEIFQSTSNLAGHSVFESLAPEAKPIAVPASTLAELFARHDIERCAFLKLDCEGGEYDIVLNGDPDVLSRVDRIAMEYHDASVDNPRYTSDELDRVLRDAGFHTERRRTSTERDHGLLYASRAKR